MMTTIAVTAAVATIGSAAVCTVHTIQWHTMCESAMVALCLQQAKTVCIANNMMTTTDTT
jgi:hypothetical protein